MFCMSYTFNFQSPIQKWNNVVWSNEKTSLFRYKIWSIKYFYIEVSYWDIIFPIEASKGVPLFKKSKDQYIIGAADSDNDSAHKEDLDCEPLLWVHRKLNILSHFCHPRVFIHNIDSMWQNVTVNKYQFGKHFFPSKSRGCLYSRGCLNWIKYVTYLNYFNFIF